MLEQAQGERLVYIQTNQNLGYGRGMNRGLAAVPSRYACIMNTDLILNREALVALWNFFEARPEAGVASPIIRWKSGRMQGFLTLSPNPWPEYVQFLGRIRNQYWKRRLKRAKAPMKVAGVQGAFFMIRRSMFSDTLFDEEFFFYYEDTELAQRNWRNGIPCYALPGVSIIHIGGQSTSASGGVLFQKSRGIYLQKIYGPSHAQWIGRLDRLRIRWKAFKYGLLSRFSSKAKIRSKRDYYARLANMDRSAGAGLPTKTDS
ncbi:MAG: hypothetical protein H6Q00_3354 [Holophagaceae bacterium]|nr:hypothetical protein [Holophagaceae bacterium]